MFSTLSSTVGEVLLGIRMRLVGADGDKRTKINAIRSNPLDAILNAIDRPTFRPEISIDVVSFHYCFQSIFG